MNVSEIFEPHFVVADVVENYTFSRRTLLFLFDRHLKKKMHLWDSIK